MVRQRHLEGGEVPDGANAFDLPVLSPGDAGGVIPSVLQPLEPRQQHILNASVSYISDNPAHAASPLLVAPLTRILVAHEMSIRTTQKASMGAGSHPPFIS
jgi:hypothetical protein